MKCGESNSGMGRGEANDVNNGYGSKITASLMCIEEAGNGRRERYSSEIKPILKANATNVWKCVPWPMKLKRDV